MGIDTRRGNTENFGTSSEPVHVAAEQAEHCSLPREGGSDGSADTAAGPADNGNLIAQVVHGLVDTNVAG
jgi:hypothetical protein